MVRERDQSGSNAVVRLIRSTSTMLTRESNLTACKGCMVVGDCAFGIGICSGEGLCGKLSLMSLKANLLGVVSQKQGKGGVFLS